MDEMQEFGMWFFNQLPDFLWSEPIKYLVALILLAQIVLVVKSIIKF